MPPPILFRSADLAARELAASEVPRLRALFDSSPECEGLDTGGRIDDVRVLVVPMRGQV